MIVVTHNIGVVEKGRPGSGPEKRRSERIRKNSSDPDSLERFLYKRTYEFGTSPETYRHRKWRQMMAEKILEVQNLKKTFLREKILHSCGRCELFSERRRSSWNRRGIRFRKKYSGKNDHPSDGYYRWKDFFHGKRYHTCEGKSSPGNLPGTSDGFSDTGRIF